MLEGPNLHLFTFCSGALKIVWGELKYVVIAIIDEFSPLLKLISELAGKLIKFESRKF
jgi:hypothetical protein